VKCTVETGSGGMIHVPSLVKFGSGIHNLIKGHTHKHTHVQEGDLISQLLIFQNTGSRLIKTSIQIDKEICLS
jgi:hypothetical protein